IDDEAVQTFDRGNLHSLGSDAIHLLGRGNLHALWNLDPLLKPLVVRDNKISAPSDTELADYARMGAPENFDDVAIRPSAALDTNNPRHGAIAIHRLRGRLLGNVDVAF